MRALSGLTPALSRRLQRQLLAHLPPAAARQLRRTLSLHAARPPAPRAARSHSADHGVAPDPPEPAADTADTAPPPSDSAVPDTAEKRPEPDPPVEPEKPLEESSADAAAPLYSTLPRSRRRSSPRETTPPILATVDVECPVSPSSLKRERDAPSPRAAAGRAATDRPLLSKYLTPERTQSLDDSYSSDAGSAAGELGYGSAYGSGSTGLALRRHSMRSAEPPRRRVSRFLRTDFFDSSADESLYARHRKERELETQKILREIREKKNKSFLDQSGSLSPTDGGETPPPLRDYIVTPRKSVSPLGLLTGKERSRSNTPFFPILDNIKETTVDAAASESKRYGVSESVKQKSRLDEVTSAKESRLNRPKSYPVKALDSIEEPVESALPENSASRDSESKERTLPRESKLVRPKSYPTSSPSPEKVYINRNIKKDDSKVVTPKDELTESDIKSDVEVSFSITLPKKTKPEVLTKTESPKSNSSVEDNVVIKSEDDKKNSDNSLSLKKYKVIKNKESKSETTASKGENGTAVLNGGPPDDSKVSPNEDMKAKVVTRSTKKDEANSKTSENETIEKKGTVKKKIIKKVSSKSKADVGSSQDASDTKTTTEKKKITKKAKEKTADDDSTKQTTVIKKKSVLQSIGHKLEKLASSKSSSPEKVVESNSMKETKNDNPKLNRMHREQSVPVNAEPTTESNLIKRAVTLTDVATLDSQATGQNKTTVSKVLGLFKKFEPKDKKPIIEKSLSESLNKDAKTDPKPNNEPALENIDKDKPRRPTSLLLNGLGRKNKLGRTSSDSASGLSLDNDEQHASKKENESKNIRNSLKLDFSRLPRVKKIVPTDPVIEPQIMNISSIDSETEKKDIPEKHATLLDSDLNVDNTDSQSRSRSRSRSTISNTEIKSDHSADAKHLDRNPVSPDSASHLLRNHDSTTPEKEDIVDRIRRKSFYSRFNEKKQRRKSSLVGPGAAEYDPLARIHSQPIETKYDVSPTSPVTYDLSPMSPGLSVSSDLSPSTERYRSLLTDLPVNTRSNLRFDNYGLNDKIDTYRSLDRNDFRKYPSGRSYLDYEQPTYGTNRYSRTKSLLENSDGSEDNSLLNSLRDPHKYNRTISMYSPGNYATYRPKRTRNSAIILKESEKEPSPENILEKIRQRKKISISVTRKPDSEKEPQPRSNISSKGEGDGAECSEKVD